MRQTLKLTITAVGEAGSVFTQPCEPVTLHESQVETPDPAPAPAIAPAPGNDPAPGNAPGNAPGIAAESTADAVAAAGPVPDAPAEPSADGSAGYTQPDALQILPVRDADAEAPAEHRRAS